MVLDHVNRIRADAGLPPAERIEAGMRGLTNQCPLARTIGAGAEVNDLYILVGDRAYWHSWRLRRWLRRFDKGKMPELVTTAPRRERIEHLDFETSVTEDEPLAAPETQCAALL